MGDVRGRERTLDDALPAQIIQSIRLQWASGNGEARIQLRPEYLGELVVVIKVDQGAVTAALHTDSPEVRRWIETHTSTLRDGLVEHGLRLERLEVSSWRRCAQATGARRAAARCARAGRAIEAAPAAVAAATARV